MSTLSGKTALVTGASRGIGRASALALAKAGAQVLVHYSNSEKEADAGAPAVQNDIDCARAALALVPDADSRGAR